jgi:hypothetical protein
MVVGSSGTGVEELPLTDGAALLPVDSSPHPFATNERERTLTRSAPPDPNATTDFFDISTLHMNFFFKGARDQTLAERRGGTETTPGGLVSTRLRVGGPDGSRAASLRSHGPGFSDEERKTPGVAGVRQICNI